MRKRGNIFDLKQRRRARFYIRYLLQGNIAEKLLIVFSDFSKLKSVGDTRYLVIRNEISRQER